jgi:hypothetical protein
MTYFTHTDSEIEDLECEVETLKYNLDCEREAFDNYERTVEELVSLYEIALDIVSKGGIPIQTRPKLDRLKYKLGLVEAPEEYD